MKEHQTKAETNETTEHSREPGTAEMPPECDLLDPHYMGGCPKCCRWDEYLPLDSEDWVVCYRHHTKFNWAGGGGSWGDPDVVRLRNAAILEHFTEVEPAVPAMPRDQAAALLRMADAVCEATPQAVDGEEAKVQRKQLRADADLVRRWVTANRTKWIQYIHVNDDENPLVKGADQQ